MESKAAATITPYAYDTLYARNTIRLLDLQPGKGSSPIHCTLRQMELPEDSDSGLSYTALSYTWGPAKPTSFIYVGGRALAVRQNLFAALTHLRHPTDTRTWWIDALCINQGDLYEKSHQVGIMARIYRTAGAVRVWLGRSDEQTSVAINYMRREVGDQKAQALALVDVIEHLLKRDYWTRVWIIQEVMMARAIDLQCGTMMLSWEKFSETCRSTAWTLSVDTPQRLVRERATRLENEEQLLQQTLESLIIRYRKSQCFDPRDRIFALLSLAADCASGNGLQVDYLLPRFELLVKTLKFSKPKDARAFVDMIFEALQKQEHDELWARARLAWAEGISRTPQVGEKAPSDDRQELRQVQITHFVTASSSFKDWVRHYSFNALLEADYARSGCIEWVNLVLSDDKANAVPTGVEICAVEIDDFNVAVWLHKDHFAILSATQIAAVANPCAELGLHSNSAGCTATKCFAAS